VVLLRLNLGCGLNKRNGFINIDCREEVKPDMLLDLEKVPYPFESNSVEEIIAKDILEHFSYRNTKKILEEWYRILKPNGIIYIQCPDLEAIALKVIFNNSYDYSQISYWVYGGQDYKENTHKAGFTIRTLKKLLESIGFKILKIQNDGGTNIMCWAIKV